MEFTAASSGFGGFFAAFLAGKKPVVCLVYCPISRLLIQRFLVDLKSAQSVKLSILYLVYCLNCHFLIQRLSAKFSCYIVLLCCGL